MFETFNGLPLHPLLVHAVVILMPLLVLAALAYVLVPTWRPRLGWVVTLLAVVAPLSALFAKLSGDAFKRRLISKNMASGGLLDKINTHQSYGTKLLYLAVVLGVLTLVLLYVPRRKLPAAGTMVLSVLVVLAAAGAAFYTFKTGDTGAKMVWTGF